MIFKKIYILLLISFTILTIVPNIMSQCNSCGTVSSVSCVSANTFNFCYAGIADTSNIQTCPTGLVCADVEEVCTQLVEPACTETGGQSCGVCNERFACLTQNTFALCFGGVPSTLTGTCPIGLICNSNSVDFCSSSVLNTPTCTNTTTASPTTTLQPATPSEICRNEINIPGRYPNQNDPSCKTYYYCYARKGIIIGQQYTCPGSSIFNPLLQQCVSSTAYQCRGQSIGGSITTN